MRTALPSSSWRTALAGKQEEEELGAVGVEGFTIVLAAVPAVPVYFRQNCVHLSAENCFLMVQTEAPIVLQVVTAPAPPSETQAEVKSVHDDFDGEPTQVQTPVVIDPAGGAGGATGAATWELVGAPVV